MERAGHIYRIDPESKDHVWRNRMAPRPAYMRRGPWSVEHALAADNVCEVPSPLPRFGEIQPTSKYRPEVVLPTRNRRLTTPVHLHPVSARGSGENSPDGSSALARAAQNGLYSARYSAGMKSCMTDPISPAEQQAIWSGSLSNEQYGGPLVSPRRELHEARLHRLDEERRRVAALGMEPPTAGNFMREMRTLPPAPPPVTRLPMNGLASPRDGRPVNDDIMMAHRLQRKVFFSFFFF
jgi:hypothetical protein